MKFAVLSDAEKAMLQKYQNYRRLVTVIRYELHLAAYRRELVKQQELAFSLNSSRRVRPFAWYTIQYLRSLRTIDKLRATAFKNNKKGTIRGLINQLTVKSQGILRNLAKGVGNG